MEKSGLISLKITADTQLQKLTNVTSLTVSNYGKSDLVLVVNDVARKVPKLEAAYGIPVGAYNLPGDGTCCDVKIDFIFAGGTGEAILDYRKIQEETINQNCQ